MSISLEKRAAALERQLASLQQQQASSSSGHSDRAWLDDLYGKFAGDPIFAEAMKLGREYRNSLRRAQQIEAKAMIYVLDTDRLTLLGHQDSPDAPRIRRRIAQLPSDDQVVTTVINFEEQMRGWMAVLTRLRYSEGSTSPANKGKILRSTSAQDDDSC